MRRMGWHGRDDVLRERVLDRLRRSLGRRPGTVRRQLAGRGLWLRMRERRRGRDWDRREYARLAWRGRRRRTGTGTRPRPRAGPAWKRRHRWTGIRRGRIGFLAEAGRRLIQLVRTIERVCDHVREAGRWGDRRDGWRGHWRGLRGVRREGRTATLCRGFRRRRRHDPIMLPRGWECIE